MLNAGTIWITGLSASGKSSLARALAARLAADAHIEPVVFDGDIFRASLPQAYGHDLADRFMVLRLLVDATRRENDAGRAVVVAAISHRHDMRLHARRHIGRFMEVYLDCPPDVCGARDPKGLYRRAHAGEFVCFPGVTEPYERSAAVEMTLDTATLSIDEALDALAPRAIAFLREGA